MTAPARTGAPGVLRIGLIVVAMLGVGWLSMAVTIGQVLARGDPGLASAWAPWAAGWRIEAASRALEKPSVPPIALKVAQVRARQALNRAPVRAASARLLGLTQLQQGQTGPAASAFAYAARMSRRDLPTSLYLIESRVAAGDIRGALHWYDVALRTSVASRATLGNVLIAATDTPAVAVELARLLAARPSWWPEFYQRFTAQANSASAIRTVARSMSFRNSDDAQFVSMALTRLIQLGALAEARALYADVAGHSAARALVRNGGFERENTLHPFEWTLASEPTYGALVERRSDARSRVLTISGSESHSVARQLLLLAPGRYRLSARAAHIPGAVEERPRLILTCLSGAAIGSYPFAAAGDTPRPTVVAITVPQGCNGQWLEVRNTPTFDAPAADVWIDDIAVRAG